jgi:hypothetical protein
MPFSENPPAAPTLLSPEAVVEQLRVLRSQIAEVTPLTTAQRKVLRDRARTSNEVLQASINVIDAADLVEQAVGQPAAEVRDLFEEANHWTAVEDELRTLLNGVAGANLVRRQHVALVTAALTRSARSSLAIRPTRSSCRTCRRSSG